jgi:hypothetical protein
MHGPIYVSNDARALWLTCGGITLPSRLSRQREHIRDAFPLLRNLPTTFHLDIPWPTLPPLITHNPTEERSQHTDTAIMATNLPPSSEPLCFVGTTKIKGTPPPPTSPLTAIPRVSFANTLFHQTQPTVRLPPLMRYIASPVLLTSILTSALLTSALPTG